MVPGSFSVVRIAKLKYIKPGVLKLNHRLTGQHTFDVREFIMKRSVNNVKSSLYQQAEHRSIVLIVKRTKTEPRQILAPTLHIGCLSTPKNQASCGILSPAMKKLIKNYTTDIPVEKTTS